MVQLKMNVYVLFDCPVSDAVRNHKVPLRTCVHAFDVFNSLDTTAAAYMSHA